MKRVLFQAAAVLVLAWLALPGAVVRAEEQETITCAEYGFSIRKPGATWTSTEDRSPPGAQYSLKLARYQRGTETSLSVQVVNANGVTEAAVARDAVKKRWQLDAKFSEIEEGTSTLAGLEAPTLAAAYDAGISYTVRQHFLVHHEWIYVLQCVAPTSEFETAEDDFQPSLESFAFVEVDENAAGLRALADRCGGEIPWAESWGEAQERAGNEGKLVLAAFEVYRGVLDVRYGPATTFMNADLVELLNERFVCLYWTDRTDAPFDDPEVYGLGPMTFGQGLLFATPEGEVVGQAVSFNPFHVYERALAVLEAHPGAPAKNPNDPAELARRGELEDALACLGKPDSAEEWRLVASIHRRRREGAKALEALATAHRLGAQVDFDEALVRIRLGEFQRAEALLEGCDSPEAAFWRGVSVAFQRGMEPARPILEGLIAEYPDDRSAWRAAALLLGLGVCWGFDLPTWPDQAQWKFWSQPDFKTADDLEQAESEALEYLLATQAETGFWPASSEQSTAAVTAICGEALLPHRKRKDVSKALDRALTVVLATDLAADEEKLFDYAIWGQIYALRFLARCTEVGLGRRATLLKKMNTIVAGLQAGQLPSGGWSYFNARTTEKSSIGFVTAAALCSLREAKAAGATIPGDMVKKASQSVEDLVRPGTLFEYMSGVNRISKERQAESVLRGVLYTLALFREERADEDALRNALDVYMGFRETVLKERGKVLCHTGEAGNASYYLLFGYGYAAEALAELPEEDRAAYRKALREDVHTLRRADGSFCDNPMPGPCYGTGMALQVLHLLAE